MEQRDYQRRGSDWLHDRGRGILGDDPGLGKSNQVLVAAEGRTLVVSPALLRDNWMGNEDEAGECAMWRPDLIEQGLITWTSYSMLTDRGSNAKGRMSVVLDKPRLEYQGPWDTVIYDEAHYLKGRKTKWALAAQKIKADRVYCATGTPIVNWAYEVFMLLRLMYPGEAGPGKKFGNYWNWVGTWFQVTPSYHNPEARDIGNLHAGWTWEEFAQGNGLDTRWLRRERDQVIKDLPPMTKQVMSVKMGLDQEKVYKALKKDLFAVIAETGNEVMSWTSGGIWPKLLKVSTGLEAEDPAVTKLGSKLATVLELMAERHHPTLLFCAFRNTAARLVAELNKAGHPALLVSGALSTAERRRNIQDFKAGRATALVGTIPTMAEGLNLMVADTAIMVERDPRPSKNEQCIRRMHRIGQTRPCLVIDLVTPNTVDSDLVKLLASKTDHQLAAMTGFEMAAAMASLQN